MDLGVEVNVIKIHFMKFSKTTKNIHLQKWLLYKSGKLGLDTLGCAVRLTATEPTGLPILRCHICFSIVRALSRLKFLYSGYFKSHCKDL